MVWRYRVDIVDFYHDRTKNPDNIVFPGTALVWQLALSRRRVTGGLPKGTDSRGPRPAGRIGMEISSGTGRKEG